MGDVGLPGPETHKHTDGQSRFRKKDRDGKFRLVMSVLPSKRMSKT